MSTEALLLSTWDWNPLLIAACAMALALYGLACRWNFGLRSFYFFAGLGLIFLALASPIAFLARGYAFSAHMLQHLLLVMVAPPLIWLGLPAPRAGSPAWGWAGSPLTAWFSGLGAMWLWHLPALCDAAASKAWVHALQSVSLLCLGALFWRPIAGSRTLLRLPPLTGILYLFSACLACSLLGIWISFAPLGVCPVFMHPPDPMGGMPMIPDSWGLTPAADQQIGGLLMWVPACLLYLGAILGLLGRLYRGRDADA